MSTSRNAAACGLALALALLAAPMLRAQNVSPLGDELVASWLRGPQDAWSRPLRQQPAIEQALRDFGYRPDRLTRQQERSLGESFSVLFPEFDPRRYRLNRSQATALVYLALVHPSGRVGDGRFGLRPCERVERRIDSLEDGIAGAGRNAPRHLGREEHRYVQEEAAEIQQLARNCGDYQLAREAQALVDLAARRQVERELVGRQLRRMKNLARLAAA